MDDERRRAFAEARARSLTMLDGDECAATVAAEAATRVYRDYSDDPPPMRRRGQPRQELPAPAQRKLTDAENARWSRYIEQLVASRVAAALAEAKTLSDVHVAATGKALGMVRAQLRQEMADAIGSLRADLTVEKAHASGELVELPKFLGKRNAG